MLSILLDNGKRYTQYHIHLLLSFIGVKHAHIQSIIDTLKDNIEPNKSITIDNLWKQIRQYLLAHNYSTSIHDLNMAWKMTQRQDCVCILLGGTSGCGKSTLASLLAHRMGITTVLSTDHVRSLLRSFDTDKSQSILWASSYQASGKDNNNNNNNNKDHHHHKNPSSSLHKNNKENKLLVEEKEKEKEKEIEIEKRMIRDYTSVGQNNNSNVIDNDGDNNNLVVQSYEAQNQIILPTLDKMIYSFYQRKENLVIEGVALSTTVMRSLVKKYQHCIPLLVYIGNEQKHTERFAIRAKYMTIAPKANKYIHYFDNIRSIQQHLCQEADLWRIPKINNTNVDRSLAIVHTTVIQVLSQLKKESSLLNALSQDLLFNIFTRVYESTWSSKQMLKRIRESQSSSCNRHNNNNNGHNNNNNSNSKNINIKNNDNNSSGICMSLNYVNKDININNNNNSDDDNDDDDNDDDQDEDDINNNNINNNNNNQQSLFPLSLSTSTLSLSPYMDDKKRKLSPLSTSISSPLSYTISKRRHSKSSSTPPPSSPTISAKRRKSLKRSDSSSPYINDLDHLDDSAWGSLTS